MSKIKKLSKVWEVYARPAAIKNGTSEKHIREIELHLKRWNDYWLTRPDGKKATKIRKIRRHHLGEWQSYLSSRDISVRTANKHLSTIRMVLNIAVEVGIVKFRPKIAQITQNQPARAVSYITDDQVDLSMFASMTRFNGAAFALWF